VPANIPFSQGLAYLPPAFEGLPYVFGSIVADNSYFNQTFIRYVWAIISDFNQLLNFRIQLIKETQRILEASRSLAPPDPLHSKEYQKADEIPILWCALSLVSDRYFADKAASYAWDETAIERITSGWYSLIATIFLPNAMSRKLHAKDIQNWASDFLTLHKRNEGPLPTCNHCESKCYYGHDVRNFLDEQTLLEFENVLGIADPVEAIASLSNSISERFFGGQNIDASLCFVVHWLKDKSAPPDKSLLFIENIRALLSEQYSLLDSANKVPFPAKKSSLDSSTAHSNAVRQQIFESVVQQAMTDAAWIYACASVMQIHNISVPEIERELNRRRQS